MAHRCNYKVEIEIKRDRIIATYNAEWKNKRLDVLKHTLELNGKETIEARDNLRYVSMGGWLVAFPNEKETMYYYSYGNSKVVLSDYREWNKMPSIYYDTENENIFLNDLKGFYSEYKYLINKLAKSGINGYKEIYKYIQLAYKYPQKLSQMEWLIENKQENLITETNLKKGLKAEIINYIKEHKEIDHLYIKAIELAIKTNAKYWDCHDAVCYFLGDLKLQDYLDKQNTNVYYYKDYKKMCLKLKKDWDDPYWRYPKNLFKAHDKLMKEIEAMKKLEEKERMKKIADSIKQKEKYSKKHTLNVDDLVFYFPYDLEDIKNQAKVLHQCLISCDYHIKYANSEKILVFIKRNNKPYATAEISQNKHIKQFYLNEKNRCRCNPSETLYDKLNMFLGTLPKKILI